jgi:hypothetical protein
LEARDYDDMQISGVIGKEKYILGLPAKRIDEDIDLVLNYINTSRHICIKVP